MVGFSWLTADTKESVMLYDLDEKGPRAVYLLQPNGETPIREDAYEGYGDFGGIDAFEWLFKMNASNCELNWRRYGDRTRRGLGIELAMGEVYKDRDTGKQWSIFDDSTPLVGGEFFKGSYGKVMPEYGQTPNQLIESGQLTKVKTSSLVADYLPIKLSYNPAAVYEALGESADCPQRGGALACLCTRLPG